MVTMLKKAPYLDNRFLLAILDERTRKLNSVATHLILISRQPAS